MNVIIFVVSLILGIVEQSPTNNVCYLSMKEGSLFVLFCSVCTYDVHLRSCSLSRWKALKEKGAWAWFHDIWTCGAKVLEY